MREIKSARGVPHETVQIEAGARWDLNLYGHPDVSRLMFEVVDHSSLGLGDEVTLRLVEIELKPQIERL